jgi:hypothetical protein
MPVRNLVAKIDPANWNLLHNVVIIIIIIIVIIII